MYRSSSEAVRKWAYAQQSGDNAEAVAANAAAIAANAAATTLLTGSVEYNTTLIEAMLHAARSQPD
jgi:hypothetical protein